MELQKVWGTRLNERVVNQFSELTEAGRLEPGHQLPPERSLAEQLGVSRNLLREAFRALELRCIIVSVPGGRRFIRQDSIQDAVDIRGLIRRMELATVRDILESRELVETEAAALAAEHLGIAETVIAKAPERSRELMRATFATPARGWASRKT